MSTGRLILEWVDEAGGFLRASNWYDDTVGVASLEAALASATNGNLQYATGAVPEIGAATPGGALYPLVQDCAQLLFQTVPGTTIKVIVPAPIASMFGPDGNTVDPTSPLVADIITAAIGHLTDASGNAVTAYSSGVKVSRRREQEGG